MRIALLTPFLHHASGFGGITPWLVNLSDGFSSHGNDVDILVNAKKETFLSDDLFHSQVRIVNLGYHKFQAIVQLLRYLKKERPEVLLAAGYRYNALAIWAKLLNRTGVKIFLSVHENVSRGSEGLKHSRRKRRLVGMRLFYPMSDGIVAVSKGVAQDLIDRVRLPSRSIKVIYNPAVDGLLEQRADEPVDHPWFVDQSIPIILGVGRLEEQKDFPSLLRAFAIVRKAQQARMVILGEGRDRQALEALAKRLSIEKDVLIPGHVENPFSYMKRSSIFVLSSAWEGFGNVIAEALAVGTPVVSTDCPSGPREILHDGEFGQLVAIGDAEGMAQAILETLAEAPQPEKLRQRARVFSVEQSVTQYLEFFGNH